MSNTELSKEELEVLTFIKSTEDGASNEDLNEKLTSITGNERLICLNQLLKMGLIIVNRRKNQLFYKAVNKQKPSTLAQDSDVEEKVVYGIIAGAGNKGIWIRDIRQNSNLNITMVNKIVKSLESKKLIKAIKLVNANKKKVYMLYNLEPDRSLSGGPWYQDQDFETEFVTVLHQQCLRYLRKKVTTAGGKGGDPIERLENTYCTLEEVHTFIKNLGISKVQLLEKDLETILMTLVYDGLAERIQKSDDVVVFRAINALVEKPGLATSPCGVCPIFNECKVGGYFTPNNCMFMAEWIEKNIEESSSIN